MNNLPRIVYDSRNYSVLFWNNEYICYSYQKPIAKAKKGEKQVVTADIKTMTQTNKNHLKKFITFLKKNY